MSLAEAETIITEFLIKNTDRIVIDLDGGARDLEKVDGGWHYAQMLWFDDVFENAKFPDECEGSESVIRLRKEGERFGLSDEEALEHLRRDFTWYGIAYGRVSGGNLVYGYIRKD